MRLLLDLAGLLFLLSVGVLVCSLAVLELEEHIARRRALRRMWAEVDRTLSGGIDVPLPPRRRRRLLDLLRRSS